MEGHSGAFFQEEKDESVVITGFNGDSVQVFLVVVRILGAFNSELLVADIVHLVEDTPTGWLCKSVVQETSEVRGFLVFHTGVLHVLNQRFHDSTLLPFEN